MDRIKETKTESDRDPAGMVEDAIARLQEALAVLQVIEDGDLLGELPADRSARRNHQSAVSMLAVLRRDLTGVAEELEAAIRTRDVIDRAIRKAPADELSRPPGRR